ncbi:MAG: hypothetical protein KA886_04785 [Candidatus Cloacimonetes bacterium]|nr:hypothetical protein [Candidatus Cloacimonadota bacterium]
MKKHVFLLMIIIMLINILSSQELPERDYVYQTLSQNGFNLQWRTTTTANLEVIISAQTTGWIAVGFGATSAMANANIIIAYVSNGVLNIRDDFGVSQTSHNSDLSLGGTNNILQSNGTEENGITRVQFQIPLNSGDQYDKVLTPGQNIPVILAKGANNSDNFTSMHTTVSSGQIMIQEIPTALEYVNTQAVWNDTMVTLIEWQTRNETNMISYRIYRSDSPDFNQASIINPNPIPAQNTDNAFYSFTYLGDNPNQITYYWIEGKEADDSMHLSEVFLLQLLSNDNVEVNINRFKVSNYPNPFNPYTRIAYEIPMDGQIELTVFDQKGHLINTLFKGFKAKGEYHDLYWDGKDLKGNRVSSGIYMLIMKSSYNSFGKKIILLK